MALTRIGDLIGYRKTIPTNVEIGDVLTDPAPVAAPAIDDANPAVEPAHNDLLRNALAIDRQLALAREA